MTSSLWHFSRWIREAPVTVGCVLICVALFFATWSGGQSDNERRAALDRWGAVIDRALVRSVEPSISVIERDLRGPVALWQGELWRIPVCAFHHVDIWHLAVNCLSALFLGKLLEPRWGSRRMLQLVAATALITMIAEFLVGNYALGFSGVIAAMFGVLCVLRYRDEELEEAFPIEAVHLGGAMLALGVVITALDVAPVANLAHMSGFFYGALAGCVTTGLPWGTRPARLIRFGVILLAVAALWFIEHPTWNGTYHVYRAFRTTNLEEKYAELQRAVQYDPQSIAAWRNLAGEEYHRGQHLTAWKTLLVGLSHNPTDPQLLTLAKRLWRKIVVTPNRIPAETALREVFGELADTWLNQFRTEKLKMFRPEVEWPSSIAERVDLSLPELSPEEEAALPRRIPPGGDAVEGRRM